MKKKSRKVVWSDFLKEEAIYRFWYTLENNNFKNAIKKAQKKGQMNYATMHNALYSGLYYPKNNYIYPFRAVKDVRASKGLGKNAVLANFMPRNELLKNIHAMNESARAIRKFAPLGYNAKLFAHEFYLIGKAETELYEKIKIKNKKLFNTLPAKNELKPNKPNRYTLSKNFMKSQKSNPTVFKAQSKKIRQQKYNRAINKYKKAKQNFEYQVFKLNLKSTKEENLMLQFLNSGLYRTSIPHYGFNPDNIVENLVQYDDTQKPITIKEILLHANKFEKGAKALSGIKNFKNIWQAEEVLINAGSDARQTFIKKESTLPETKVGFLNAFCEMISNELEINPLLKDKTLEKDAVGVADSLIDVIKELKEQYNRSTNSEEKEEVSLQLEKMTKSLADSNEHNI